jgi:hypothetical protein
MVHTDDLEENLIARAEAALRDAEQAVGANNMLTAERLEELAALLRKHKVRLLDAANLEARAKLIRQNWPIQVLNLQLLQLKN